MSLIGHIELGLRWLTCGRRLFQRNPWLLGSMGFLGAALITALALIPMVGGMLIAFVAPLLLASTYLAIDYVSRQKMFQPIVLRKRAIKQSPRALVSVFRDEKRVIPAIVTALYGMVTALVASVLVHVVAGGAWADNWTSLGIAALSEVLAAWLLALGIFFVAAWPLIYGLSLAFLQRRPLFPAMGRSFKTAARHALALLVIMGFVLVPFLAGAIVSIFSAWMAYATTLVLGTAVLPITAASLYCSYRTIFPQQETTTVVGSQPIPPRQSTSHSPLGVKLHR